MPGVTAPDPSDLLRLAIREMALPPLRGEGSGALLMPPHMPPRSSGPLEKPPPRGEWALSPPRLPLRSTPLALQSAAVLPLRSVPRQLRSTPFPLRSVFLTLLSQGCLDVVMLPASLLAIDLGESSVQRMIV